MPWKQITELGPKHYEVDSCLRNIHEGYRSILMSFSGRQEDAAAGHGLPRCARNDGVIRWVGPTA